eukprot:TRINITY_DN1059_c0_g1_i5.p1 TRINITY_DN1059_c0_g1~~TRINITY_DN1059_c0_g1_i5.p1  ORF type:complete len:193 (+),score=-25.40 TRINITY_DN1059_c0_g1_i5:417-995(+)
MYLLAYKVYLFQGHIQNDQSLQTKVVGPILVPTFNQKEEIGQTFGLDQATFHFKKGQKRQYCFRINNILTIRITKHKYDINKILGKKANQKFTFIIIKPHYCCNCTTYLSKYTTRVLQQIYKFRSWLLQKSNFNHQIPVFIECLFLYKISIYDKISRQPQQKQYLKSLIVFIECLFLQTIIKVIFKKSNSFY